METAPCWTSRKKRGNRNPRGSQKTHPSLVPKEADSADGRGLVMVQGATRTLESSAGVPWGDVRQPGVLQGTEGQSQRFFTGLPRGSPVGAITGAQTNRLIRPGPTPPLDSGFGRTLPPGGGPARDRIVFGGAHHRFTSGMSMRGVYHSGGRAARALERSCNLTK